MSENGWQTTDIFTEWFHRFKVQVPLRPLLLLYDGSTTHISLEVCTAAMRDQIIILKLAPQITSKIQPLDKTCFGPLKRMWLRHLNDRMSTYGASRSLGKGEFVDLLCSMWRQGLHKSNIISGFESTGLFPCDRTKYDPKIFDKRLLEKYNHWVSEGKPAIDWNEMVKSGDPQKRQEASVLLEPSAPLPNLPGEVDFETEKVSIPSPRPSTSAMSTTVVPATHFESPLNLTGAVQGPEPIDTVTY